jgi:C1A family cysteine protease
MKAAIMIGAPPESHWPYDVKRYDDEPSSFVYSVAQNFRALKYLNVGLEKHDEKRLSLIKTSIEAGLPVAFGFTVYDTIDDETGVVSMPSRTSKSEGGHAVFAVGYDDKRGQLLFQNSWGKQWGDGGYGWLPYEYVISGLADDFWTVVDMSWIDLPQFE